MRGINQSRNGSEDSVGGNRRALRGADLSLDRVCVAGARVVDDVIAFTAWSSFAHAAVMGTQAWRNMISRGELAGVVVPVVIGIDLIALAQQTARHTRCTPQHLSTRLNGSAIPLNVQPRQPRGESWPLELTRWRGGRCACSLVGWCENANTLADLNDPG